MKINSVYISAFGKFEDKTFDFSDGLNVIFGENEDGKTTLMTFIRMMFYGSSVKSNEELIKNPRKKYAPRNDKPMAGRIDFEIDGKKFRIERIFKTSNATDKIAVTNLQSGERETFTGKEDLGKRFLGLSLDAAEKSVFLSDQTIFSKNSADGELNSRLSNLAGTGEEDVSADEILGKIEKARNTLLTKTGRGGKITKDSEELETLKLKLNSARRTEQARKECNLRLENEQLRLSSIKTEIDKLTAHIKSAEGGKRFAKLKEYCDSVTVLNSVNKKLINEKGSPITVSLLSDGENALSEYKLLSERLPSLNEKEALYKQQADEAKAKLDLEESSEEIGLRLKEKQTTFDNVSREIELFTKEAETLNQKAYEAEHQKKKIRPIFLILTILGIVALALSFVLTSYKNILLAGGGALALTGLILTLTVRKKNPVNLKELKEQEAILRQKVADNQAIYNELISVISNLTAKEAVAKQKELTLGEAFTQKFELLKGVREEIEKINARLDSAKNLLLNLTTSNMKEFSPKGMEIILYSHKTNLQKKENLEVKVALLKKDLDNISFEDAEKELSVIPEGAISVGDLDDLNERLIFKKKELETLRQNIADDLASAKNDFRFAVHPTVLEQKIKEKEELLAKEYRFCEAADIAYEALSDAFLKVRETFGSVLGERTSEIFSALTSGKYSSVSVSKNFDIAVEEKDIFGTNDWQTLSSGTIDQAYFALRLTVSELLSNDGQKLPLILDDPFDRYDDKRSEKAMQFLEDYSKDSQTLLFTCHKQFTENRSYMTLK